jgi:hypothetical protein
MPNPIVKPLTINNLNEISEIRNPMSINSRSEASFKFGDGMSVSKMSSVS